MHDAHNNDGMGPDPGAERPARGAGRADYFGQVLNRAARMQGAAHGGQVLAEGLAADRALQEWRTLYPQLPTRTSRTSIFLPGECLACRTAKCCVAAMRRNNGRCQLDAEDGQMVSTVGAPSRAPSCLGASVTIRN
jgi:hypothetical protein